MSMNLGFKKKCCNSFIDFPFQTPTKLSYEVLKESNKKNRIDIIKDQLIKWQWDQDDINHTMNEIIKLMEDQQLELILI